MVHSGNRPWGPLHTQDWEPMTITLQAISLVEKAEPVQVRFILYLKDQHSMWMQDGCKVYMDSYMASSRSCFMVTWTIFKKHLLDVCLTLNRETMALQTLPAIDLFYFIMREDPHELKFIERALGWEPIHIWGALKTPDQSCTDNQVRGVHFSGPPYFGLFATFFGFFFAKFGFYGPKLP